MLQPKPSKSNNSRQKLPRKNLLWEDKKTLRKAVKMDTHNDPENEVSELQNSHKPTAEIIDYREGHFKDNAKIRLEQTNDPILRNLRARIEGEPYDETEFTQDYRHIHYLKL